MQAKGYELALASQSRRPDQATAQCGLATLQVRPTPCPGPPRGHPMPTLSGAPPSSSAACGAGERGCDARPRTCQPLHATPNPQPRHAPTQILARRTPPAQASSSSTARSPGPCTPRRSAICAPDTPRRRQGCGHRPGRGRGGVNGGRTRLGGQRRTRAVTSGGRARGRRAAPPSNRATYHGGPHVGRFRHGVRLGGGAQARGAGGVCHARAVVGGWAR